MESTLPGKSLKPEIAHVLFLDIVGYSKESTTGQSRIVAELNQSVNESPTYAAEKASGNVLPLATGDGMALVFFHDVCLPAQCAVELAGIVEARRLPLRMGIHSGLVQRQSDIAGNENVAGEGINTAQRVMDFGDVNHILVSGQYASWLEQFDHWKPLVHRLGESVAKHGVRLSLASLHGEGFGRGDAPAGVAPAEVAPSSDSKKIVLLYKRKAEPDEQVLYTLQQRLTEIGHQVFIDQHLRIGVNWAKAIEEKIRSADAVIAILSDASVGSEMLEYELETAVDEFRRRGKPHLLPVRIGTDSPVNGTIGALVNPLHFTVWSRPSDDGRMVTELISALNDPAKLADEMPTLEPAGEAVPPDSPFYVERAADAEFSKALGANESIILVKGPRQVGKTSLLGRGSKLVKERKWRRAMTDFQKLSMAQLGSEEVFYKLLATTLARQLRFDYNFSSEWLDGYGGNINMDNFIRELIEVSQDPLVWFMDEADKVFGTDYASDFFGLIRSWHNSRATEPDEAWARFTVVIGYATEAHLFIKDLNQSPFNVGRHIALSGFSFEEVSELNKRYGTPLKSPGDVRRLHNLIDGQPFLTRRAFDVLASGQMDLDTMLEIAARDDGPFADHLKRILISVTQLPAVLEAMTASLANPDVKDSEGYQRLLASGVLHISPTNGVQLRCELYRRYLASHLSG